jgi:hypothetical protein
MAGMRRIVLSGRASHDILFALVAIGCDILPGGKRLRPAVPLWKVIVGTRRQNYAGPVARRFFWPKALRPSDRRRHRQKPVVAFYGPEPYLQLRRGAITTICRRRAGDQLGARQACECQAWGRRDNVVFIKDALTNVSADLHDVVTFISPRKSRVVVRADITFPAA